jgi:hypothetical protein
MRKNFFVPWRELIIKHPERKEELLRLKERAYEKYKKKLRTYLKRRETEPMH